LWAGFGGVCEDTNNGDPIVLYDQIADRWMASQFAWQGDGPFYECIAVSATGDPTGEWHRYEFLISQTKLNDYPKFGVWPDAYYMAVNQFIAPNFDWGGQGAVAFERDAMLSGQPAQMVYFDLGEINDVYGGQLPADADGSPPPAGTPNYFVEMDDDALGFDTDRLSVWEFHVDWENTDNSTFGIGGEPNYHIDTAAFDANLCGFARSCIPQPDTAQGLDAISDRLMFRLQYRDFGSHASMVVNHTVDVDGSDHAGIRWYELRDTGDGFGIHQQGTYAPDDEHRWMGSAAMDIAGNIAIGYSASSEDTYPSIRAAGRLAGDPLGELSQGESEMLAGGGSQTHTAARWGDYSMMSVDPVDECTFWYTTEYYSETSTANWQTRIGHFKFPSCSAGPSGTLTGKVTADSEAGAPIAGATVTAGDISTTTGEDGTYSFTLPVGTYDVAASAFGHEDGAASDVAVLEGETTTQNFALAQLPSVVVSGSVSDGSGHDWPLDAKITVDGVSDVEAYTDPFTGGFELTLPGGASYDLNVETHYPGYLPHTETVDLGTDDVELDVAVPVDPDTCDAPGYAFGSTGLSEDFNDGELPSGWTVVDNVGDGYVWQFDNPGGRTNNTGGDGELAIVDSDEFGPGNSQDTELISPAIDLSEVAEPMIRFNQDFNWYSGGQDEATDVDVSIDGGGTWETVYHHEGSDVPGPRLESIPIPQAGGESDVQIRFHYGPATYDFWWQVDNVGVGGCDAVDGGLVAGNVTDANTGDALVDVTVTSDDDSDITATTSTPENPNVDDGYYWLFSSLTGERDFTASLDRYTDQTETADVAANGIVRRDFDLGAALLTVDPTQLSANLKMGQQATRTFTVSNEGTAPADVELGLGSAGFEILGAETSGGLLPFGEVTTAKSTEPDLGAMRAIPRNGLAPNATAEKPGQSATPDLPPTEPDEQTITHSESQEIISGNSVACSPDNGVTTSDNAYLRTFTLTDFGVGGDFAVSSVSFGVEASSPAQPLTVNLYTLDGDLTYENMTPIGSAEVTLDPQELSLVTVPVEGTAPAGSTLVVEIDSPDQSGSGRLFVGSNDSGQTAPSYIRSEGCAMPEPTDLAEIGFAGMHIVMNVTGDAGGADVPWLTVEPEAFSLDPGESVEVTVGLDGNVDQPGTYTAKVNIGHDTPRDVGPVDITMEVRPPLFWGKITGTVTGTTCDGDTAPLEGAIVQFEGRSSDVTLLTDEDGEYAYWASVIESPAQLIVAANDHIPQTERAWIWPFQTATHDFALDALCL
jgi:hypothetical protein